MEDGDQKRSANQQVYEVEAILKRRERAGKSQYLIKWKGFDQNSWEPERNIDKQAVKEYDAAVGYSLSAVLR